MNELILKARKLAYKKMVREAEQRHGFNSSDEDGYAEAEDKIIATAKAAYKAKYNEEYDDLEKSPEAPMNDQQPDPAIEEQSEDPAPEQETEQPPAVEAKQGKKKAAPKKQKEDSGPTKSSLVRQIVTDLIGNPSSPSYVSAKAVKTLLEKNYQMQIHTSFCVSLINKTYKNLGIDKPARPKTEKAKTSEPKKTVTSSSEEE